MKTIIAIKITRLIERGFSIPSFKKKVIPALREIMLKNIFKKIKKKTDASGNSLR